MDSFKRWNFDPTPFELFEDQVDSALKSTTGGVPSDKELASTGLVVNPEDISVPATIRAIAKGFQGWTFRDEDDTVHVVRWPDGIVAVVRCAPWNTDFWEEELPRAYWEAYKRLLDDSAKAVLGER